MQLAKRHRVFLRDGHACLNCGATEELTLDHICPLARGGTNGIDNLQTLCKTCNGIKANQWPCPFTGKLGNWNRGSPLPEPDPPPKVKGKAREPKHFVPRPPELYHSSHDWRPKRRKSLR